MPADLRMDAGRARLWRHERPDRDAVGGCVPLRISRMAGGAGGGRGDVPAHDAAASASDADLAVLVPPRFGRRGAADVPVRAGRVRAVLPWRWRAGGRAGAV